MENRREACKYSFIVNENVLSASNVGGDGMMLTLHAYMCV
jgi:hypothetical protein